MSNYNLKIPDKGIPHEELLEILGGEMKKDDIRPYSGHAFGLCYIAGKEHSEFLKKVYSSYLITNGLNPMAYPSLKTMENEVVSMTAWMLNGNKKTAGTMTSGGTESILMAVKTHRDWARDKKGIQNPEMILPHTVHPAFSKAAHYFDVKPIYIPCGEDYRVDINQVEESINENTILIVGSAPCYPYGVIDPIEELAALAKEKGIGCHVDACLGGYFLPWVERLGYPLSSKWDFRIPGVTSISADLHKYGYAAKPASVVLYHSDKLRQFQFYVYSNWCGGIYGSPSAPGTRPGGAVAAAWAAMNALGQDGYMEATKDTMNIAQRLMKGINAIDGLHIIGEPEMAIYAWKFEDSIELDFFELIDLIENKAGWMINRMQNPPAAHHMTSRVHMPIVDEFLNDLRWAMKELKTKPSSKHIEGQAAMYGMMGTIEDKGKINDIIRRVLLNQYSYTPMKKKK
jgi:glutamate/tyrosine decarboxylase-like PLP-dependent enzyme